MTPEQQQFIEKLAKTPCPKPNLGECWVFTGAKDKDGYGKVRFRKKVERANRVSHILFLGPLEDEEVVLHECDNPPCCRPGHLRKGSQLENMQDKVAKGRQVNVSVITRGQAEYIREECAKGRDRRELARELGIGATTVSAAKTGQNWRCDLRGFDLKGVAS